MPITDLRTPDIADLAGPKNEVRSDRDQKDASPIMKMPAAGLLSAIAENQTDDLDLLGINPIGSEGPESAISTEVVTDPELLELLEQLSVTIDTANNALEMAASAQGEGMENPVREPATEPLPEPYPDSVPESEPAPDLEPDDLPPLAAQFISMSPTPPPPMDLKRNQGFSKTVTATISVLAVIAGVGWLLYTNPWLMDDAGRLASTTDRSALSTKIVERAPIFANVAPGSVPAIAPRLQSEPSVATKVSIDQPVAGRAGQPIALAINLPANTAQAEMSIMIQGVPDKAQLSAGKSLGGGNWLLGESELSNLRLDTAASFVPAKFNLDVILVRSDGKVPEVHKLSVIIEPAAKTVASAPDTGVAAPGSATLYDQTGVAVTVPLAPEKYKAADLNKAIPKPAAPIARVEPVKKSPAVPAITRQEIKALLTRANTLLENGDVAGARLLLEYAAQRGSRKAMIIMGKTYQPEHLASLGVQGVRPDQERAGFWSERAAAAIEAQ